MIAMAGQNTNIRLEHTFLQVEQAEAGRSGRLVFMMQMQSSLTSPSTIERRARRDHDDE